MSVWCRDEMRSRLIPVPRSAVFATLGQCLRSSPPSFPSLRRCTWAYHSLLSAPGRHTILACSRGSMRGTRSNQACWISRCLAPPSGNCSKTLSGTVEPSFSGQTKWILLSELPRTLSVDATRAPSRSPQHRM